MCVRLVVCMFQCQRSTFATPKTGLKLWAGLSPFFLRLPCSFLHVCHSIPACRRRSKKRDEQFLSTKRPPWIGCRNTNTCPRCSLEWSSSLFSCRYVSWSFFKYISIPSFHRILCAKWGNGHHVVEFQKKMCLSKTNRMDQSSHPAKS